MTSPQPTLLTTVAVSTAVVATAAYTTFRASRALASPPPLPSMFSVPCPHDPGARMHPICGDMDEVDLVNGEFKAVGGFNKDNMTMWRLFDAMATKQPNKPCHGTLTPDCSAFTWETYGQIHADILALGRGMERLNVLTSTGTNKYPFVPMRVCGVFGINSSNWVRAEYAILSRAGTTVTLYSTLAHDGIAYVINLTDLQTVVCLAKDLALKCLDAKKSCPSLTTIIVPTQDVALQVMEHANKNGVRVLTFDDLRKAGSSSTDNHAAPIPAISPTTQTVYTFCFTSGSSGPPKGALLRHGNMVVNLAMTNYVLLNSRKSEPGIDGIFDIYLSYLPLAHQMERMLQSLIYANGGSIGFSRGIPEKIMDDVALLRPTIFASVPRLLNRLALGIQTQVTKTGGLKAKLFNYALQSKLYDLTHYGIFKHPVWDALVFNKLVTKMGLGRCKAMLTGSAPIPPRTLDFLRAVFGMPLTEGWGMTELSCTGMSTHPYDVRTPDSERQSHVGGPTPCTHIKLIASTVYKPEDRKHGNIPVLGRGEILLKAKSVMMGYYGMEEKSKETVDSDGWLHTGDVAVLNVNGTYSIVDRASNVFKLQQGEYVEPDRIERSMLRCTLLAQCFVFGTTLNSKLVAIGVPNPDILGPFLTQRGARMEDLATSKVREVVLEEVVKCCKEAGLRGYEIPARLALVDKPFAMETGVLTPTFKIVRNVAKVVYRDEILGMYKEVGEECKI